MIQPAVDGGLFYAPAGIKAVYVQQNTHKRCCRGWFYSFSLADQVLSPQIEGAIVEYP